MNVTVYFSSPSSWKNPGGSHFPNVLQDFGGITLANSTSSLGICSQGHVPQLLKNTFKFSGASDEHKSLWWRVRDPGNERPLLSTACLLLWSFYRHLFPPILLFQIFPGLGHIAVTSHSDCEVLCFPGADSVLCRAPPALQVSASGKCTEYYYG